jgi:hypothetical protein
LIWTRFYLPLLSLHFSRFASGLMSMPGCLRRSRGGVFVRRRVYRLVLLLALILCRAAWAADEAADVAGNWQIQCQGRQGSQQGSLTLQQNGSELTGAMQSPPGSAPLSGELKGNAITMKVHIQEEQRSFALAFTGTVEGDKMSGHFPAPRGTRWPRWRTWRERSEQPYADSDATEREYRPTGSIR